MATNAVEVGAAGGARSSNPSLWRIPPLPGTLALVLKAADDEDASCDDMVKALCMDEMLASHVLRAANSVALGCRSPARDVGQAVGRLGSTRVRSIALSGALDKAAPLPREVGGIPRIQFWEHNWATAIAASELAHLYDVSRGEAHLAGLLHDVGKLVFASWRPDQYATCIEKAAANQAILSAVESTRLGINHAALGAEALQAWGLPETSCTGAIEHHNPARLTPLSPVGRMVQAADAIAHSAGFGHSGNPSPLPPRDCIAADAQLSEDAVRRCIQRLKRERNAIEGLAGQLGG